MAESIFMFMLVKIVTLVIGTFSYMLRKYFLTNAKRWIFLENLSVFLATQGVASTLKTYRFSWIEWLMTAILDGCIEGFDYKEEMG